MMTQRSVRMGLTIPWSKEKIEDFPDTKAEICAGMIAVLFGASRPVNRFRVVLARIGVEPLAAEGIKSKSSTPVFGLQSAYGHGSEINDRERQKSRGKISIDRQRPLVDATGMDLNHCRCSTLRWPRIRSLSFSREEREP